MKKTKIVCTLGPASSDEKTIRKLYEAGMNVARLNFSHANYDNIKKVVKRIRKVSKGIAILLDTKGPEIRTGKVANNELKLIAGQEMTVTTKEVLGDADKLTVRYPRLSKLEKGNTLLIDDGMIEMEILRVKGSEAKVKVRYGGTLGSQKTVSIRGHNVEIPFLSQKDKDDIKFGIEQKMDFVAASFVRTTKDIEQLRTYLKKHKSKMHIIAKIEHWEAIDNMEDIIHASDAIMVARGDLGVEVDLERVPKLQEKMIERCNTLGKPVIVATQMLESMKQNPRPTRAEVGDVATAILEGADAVMLSAETAAGKYPVKSVEMMARIAREYDKRVTSTIKGHERHESVSLLITRAAHIAANALNATYIYTPTETGFTARNVSRFKPKAPIIAITKSMEVFRQLQLSWGVTPHLGSGKVEKMVKEHASKKKIGKDETFIVTEGYKTHEQGKTNLLYIFKGEDVIKW